MKEKRKRSAHVRAQFNKRSVVPFVPFLLADILPRLDAPSPPPTQPNHHHHDSPLLFHPPEASPPLPSFICRAECGRAAERTPRTAHLVFWLRSEPARQISSSRDFYLILPRYNVPNISPPPDHTDRVSSNRRRSIGPPPPKIRLRVAPRLSNNFTIVSPSRYSGDEIAAFTAIRQETEKRAAPLKAVGWGFFFARIGICEKRGGSEG